MGKNYAVADIGSNTVHGLIAEVDGRRLRRIDNRSEWLGLGEDVARTGRIPEAKTQRLIDTLNEFKSAARIEGVEAVRVFATEAIRAAVNGPEVLEAVAKGSKIQVQVIAPRREAELSLLGASLDAPLDECRYLIEIGGGSVQVATITNATVIDDVSLPLGTGRLLTKLDKAPPLDRETIQAFLDDIAAHLDKALPSTAAQSARAVASGGVARGCWRALHPDGAKTIEPYEIDYLFQSCSRNANETTSARFGVKLKRAVAALPGAALLSVLSQRLNLNSIFVSEFGVREGAILELNRTADL